MTANTKERIEELKRECISAKSMLEESRRDNRRLKHENRNLRHALGLIVRLGGGDDLLDAQSIARDELGTIPQLSE